MKKLVYLFSFLIISMFFFSFSVISVNATSENTELTNLSGEILTTQEKMNVSLPVGRESQITYDKEVLGLIPSSLYSYSRTGLTTISTQIENNEKCLKLQDNSNYGFIKVATSITNVTSFQGTIESVMYIKPTTLQCYSSIQICSNETAGKREFIWIDFVSQELGGQSAVLMYLRNISGTNYPLFGFFNLGVFTIKIDYFLNNQTFNLWMYLHNLGTFSFLSGLTFRGQCFEIPHLYVDFYTFPVNEEDQYVCIFAIDSSFSFGYYPYRSAPFISSVVQNGYLGVKTIFIDLFANYEKEKTNYNFTGYISLKIDSNKLSWIELANYTIVKATLQVINVTFFTYERYSTFIIKTFSTTNKSNSMFIYNISITVNYTLVMKPVPELYVNAIFSLLLFIVIPVIGWRKTKKVEVFLITTFIIVIVLLIISQSLLTQGGVLAIASYLVLILKKHGENK